MTERWLRWIIVAVCLVVVVVAGFSLWASMRLARAQKAFHGSYAQLPPGLSLSERRPANGRALQLEVAAASLGLNWAPKTSERFQAVASLIPEGSRKRWDELRPVFSRWVEENAGALAAARAPLPEEVKAFLAGHANDLATVRELLLQGSLPQWEEDLTQGLAAPIPNLLAGLSVARLLVADAFWRLENRDPATAEQDLLAVRRLGEALVARSELISVLVGTAVNRLAVFSLRSLSRPSREWLSWLEGTDFSRPLERALVAEAAIALRCPKDPEARGLLAHFSPWRRAACAAGAERIVALATALRENPCLGKLDAEALRASVGQAFREGDEIFGSPNLVHALLRVASLNLHAALTWQALAARMGENTPHPGDLTVARGPCRGVVLHVRQEETSWIWSWPGSAPELPKNLQAFRVVWP
ncbi:MAG: hypothetical protein ACP5NF_04790 [Thermoanaerobaculum sp.]